MSWPRSWCTPPTSRATSAGARRQARKQDDTRAQFDADIQRYHELTARTAPEQSRPPARYQCWPLWPKPPAPRVTGSEILDDFQRHLHHRHHDQLRDTLAGLNLRSALMPRFQHDTISGPW